LTVCSSRRRNQANDAGGIKEVRNGKCSVHRRTHLRRQRRELVHGEVLVQGNRIRRVAAARPLHPDPGRDVIDARRRHPHAGPVRCPAHFSWNDSSSLEGISMMPPEEHILYTAVVARPFLDHGFTMCVGAAAAKPRLDVVIRNAINSGMYPGPRYLANGQAIGTGGLGDHQPAAPE